MAAGVLANPVQAAPSAELKLRVTPERGLIYSDGPREVIVQIEIEAGRGDASNRAPMNLALVLDRSGSMQGPKIEKARQAACVAIDQLADDDYLSLVTFDNRTEVLIPPVRVGDQSHREMLKSRIDQIRPGGGTAIHAGVTLGAEQVRKHLDKEFVNRIILMSDGIANVGPSRTSDLADLGRDLRRDGIAVTTIGLGDDYNEDLMTALAESSDGNYYYVRDAEKLPGIFSEELGAARSIIAREITIHIKTPEGVRLKEIIGRPDIKCGGDSTEATLPEIFGGDHRRFLARCVIDAKSRAPLDAASVDLSYSVSGGAKVKAERQTARIGFTEDSKKSLESVHSGVAKDVAITLNRSAKELAVKLADEGKSADAAQVLRDQALANAAAPAPAQIPEVEAENRKLENSARELEKSKALGGATRKQMQYENWQDKYQKR